MMIKTAKRKRLTLITRDRVTTLLFTSLVVAKTKIEENIKMGMKKYLSIVPLARIFAMYWSWVTSFLGISFNYDPRWCPH